MPRGGSQSLSGSPGSPRCASSRAGLGAETLSSFPPSLPRSGARRAARLQAPRPRGEQWARVEAALRPRRSENRSGAQSARPARLPGVRPAGRRAIKSVPPPRLCDQPLASSPRLLRPSPAGPSRGSRRSRAEPSGPPGLHQRPPPPERPPAALGSRAPEYS